MVVKYPPCWYGSYKTFLFPISTHWNLCSNSHFVCLKKKTLINIQNKNTSNSSNDIQKNQSNKSLNNFSQCQYYPNSIFILFFLFFSGSKFAPYGKDGCKINDGNYDQSDNSMDSGRYSASRHRINRVNSSDSQCYFERPPSSHSRSNSRAASTSR